MSAYAGTQFPYTEFQDECQTRSVCLTLAAPEHQEMNGQVKVIWRILHTIAQSLMIHAQVLESYIHFSLMYMEDCIFLILPIKYLINWDGDPTTPFKLATCMKPSISHLSVLFFPCVVQIATSHVITKGLNVCQQVQKSFWGIYIGIPHHQKWYLVYVPHKHKIIYLYDVVFGDNFSNALAYTSQPYSESMAMQPAVSYIPYDISS